MNKARFLNILNRLIQAIVLFLFVRFLLSLKWHIVWDSAGLLPKAIGLTILLTVKTCFLL